MVVKYARHFSKDLDKINQASVKKEILKIIEEVEIAENILVIRNLKKLKGFTNAYRIKTGDFRIGIFVENNTIEFARIANRKNIYRVFP